MTARIPVGSGFTLVDRQRGEYRMINDRVAGRYRNRLQIERPVSIGERKITPYMAGEAHYDGRYHQWSRFLYAFGSRVPVGDHLTLDFYYMRNLDTRARPGFLHVTGISTRLEF